MNYSNSLITEKKIVVKVKIVCKKITMAFVIERAHLRRINNFIFAFHYRIEMLIR